MAATFGAFKTRLCEEITVEYCRNLCTYFGFSPAKTETIIESRPHGLAFLGELENQGQIISNDVRKLREAFKHLKMDVAYKMVEDYENSRDLTESSTTLPDDLDSDEELDVTKKPSCNTSFEEFKERCGLAETLTLKKMLEIKSPERTASRAELFWEKITSLDYRITSSDITHERSLSVRDLIFAILYCSENVLRQDIVAKMSSCQLAVPVVLNGVNKSKPVFLYWAMRTIRKKIKILKEKDPIERPMYKHKTFTVSFLRIEDVRISKSDLLNSLLSDCQGNQAHSFFITKREDLVKPTFSKGSIEVVWYIPQARGKGFLTETTGFLNLRGDSQNFPIQTEFLCKVSNVVFVLIGKQNWKAHKHTIENMKKMTTKLIILAIREADDMKADEIIDLRHDSVIVVRKLQMKVVNEEICRRINKSQKSNKNLWSLENYKDHVQDIVEVDISDEYLARIEGIVEKIVPKQVDIKCFKNTILRLYPIWIEWAKLDEMTFTTDSDIEQQRALREEEQMRKRDNQITTTISDEVKAFWELLHLVDNESELFDDCLIYLQTLLFDLTHMHQRSSKSAQKILHDRLQDKTGDTQVGIGGHADLRKKYLKETKAQWQMSIGIEDFMRELGQLFEACVQSSNDHKDTVEVMRLPVLAAQFIAKGNSLEILDDKSYCVPTRWIYRIFEELKKLLGENAKVFVVSVIGVQGSGKSTLLNSMFGTKFPVSAGRCTRGLFFRLLKVQESFATVIGCNYFIVVDTEGLKADHGGLDEIISTRLDNKMVTLAMCIADLVIVNIEGENIGTDMTNFLQIAAYALIRMKKVDLQSQCRIIQQRVSDITASAKNKTNMLKIIYKLDKAVHNVAEAEGFLNRYENFSDIFKLNMDNHTQYVSNLWSGNMNPPNHLYGEVVINFKEQIFDSIGKGDLRTQFTFETFCRRLLAVDKALKDENFVLNFEDISRAMAYNDVSLKCNKWLGDVRIEVMEEWLTWQRQIITIDSSEREQLCEDLRNELSQEIRRHGDIVNNHFESYIEKSDDAKYFFHNDYFKSWIASSLLKIQSDIQIKISDELKASKWASTDIHSLVARKAKEIRIKIIENAIKLRESDSQQFDSQQIWEHFGNVWDELIRGILQAYQSKIVREEDIEKECTSILLSLLHENAVCSDVNRLLNEEGSISKHCEDFNPEKYMPNKSLQGIVMDKVQQFVLGREKNTKDFAVKFLVHVKESTLDEFKTNCKKSFDSYFVHVTLQKALENLTLTKRAEKVKIPPSLLAKVLLHLCGKISVLARDNHRKHKRENSFQILIDKEKDDIYLDFRSFYSHTFQDERAYEYVCNLLIQQFSRFTLGILRSNVIKYFNEQVKTKQNLHVMILRYMLKENKPFNYIHFIQDNVSFMTSWLREKMSHTLTRNEENISWIQFQYEHILSQISPLLVPSVEKLSEANSMKEWCETISKHFSHHHKTQFDLKEAYIYQISNFTEFSTRILNFCRSTLIERTKENVHLPEPDDIRQCEIFLEQTLNRPFDDVLSSFLGCQEQCPFCKAPCREESTEKHEHVAFCHYPRGLAGKTWQDTKKLVEECCTSSVSTETFQYEKDDEYFLYQDYANHYPSWKIPTSNNIEQYYWKWVFFKINIFCSEYYTCFPAEIPPAWQSPQTEKRAKAALDHPFGLFSFLPFFQGRRNSRI